MFETSPFMWSAHQAHLPKILDLCDLLLHYPQNLLLVVKTSLSSSVSFENSQIANSLFHIHRKIFYCLLFPKQFRSLHNLILLIYITKCTTIPVFFFQWITVWQWACGSPYQMLLHSCCELKDFYHLKLDIFTPKLSVSFTL